MAAFYHNYFARHGLLRPPFFALLKCEESKALNEFDPRRYEMKERLLRVTAIMAIVLALTAISASAQTHINVQTFTVPFAFNVGNEVLPAGDYKVYVENETIRLHKTDGKANVIAITRRKVSVGDTEREVKLKFRRYGDRYYLSQVWPADGVGRELRRPRQEATDLAKNYSIVDVVGR
jgi:hypothetical protein